MCYFFILFLGKEVQVYLDIFIYINWFNTKHFGN